MRKVSSVKRNWSQARESTSRGAYAREELVATPRGRLTERESQRGASPYEVRYEVAHGYCCERAIVLP